MAKNRDKKPKRKPVPSYYMEQNIPPSTLVKRGARMNDMIERCVYCNKEVFFEEAEPIGGLLAHPECSDDFKRKRVKNKRRKRVDE